jgi:hypothetical protein
MQPYTLARADILQYWVDRKSIEQHREVISVLFREAVMKKQLDDLNDYMVGLTQLAVLQPLPLYISQS